MAVCRGRPVEQVCTGRRLRDMRTMQSESRVKPGTHSRSEASLTSLIIWLTRRCKHWHPLAPGRRYGTKRSPLSEYMSLHLSLTYNKQCVPFENKMREIYFYKEVCFISFIEVCSLSSIMFLDGSMRSIQQL